MEIGQLELKVESVDSATSPDTVNSDVNLPASSSSTRRGRCRQPLEPLIVAALRSAPGKRLLLADIYRYIETHSVDYRDAGADTGQHSTPDDGGRRARSKEPAWKIHVRHILSVRRDVFPLTSEKDGKRRGRYHALDELAYADRLACKAQRTGGVDRHEAESSSSNVGDHAKRRQRRRNHDEVDRATRPYMQGDGQCAVTVVQSGQLSSCVTAAPPARLVSWQSTSTSGQQGGLVQLPAEPGFAGGGASCDTMARLPGASDGGNSRDSWSSTSSSVVARQQVPADQPCPAYRDPAPYGRQVHQQPYQLYDWAHRHTWGQVETDKSGCRQTYPQHVRQPRCETFHHANRRPQSQHQYLRPTIHPYLHQAAVHQTSACSQTHHVAGIQQVHATQFNTLTARQPGADVGGNSGSMWIGTAQRQQCVAATRGPPPSTASQLNPASQTPRPCHQWSDSAHTAVPETWQRQYQHDAGLLANNGSSILPSELRLRWYTQPSCDNVVNDAGLYRINDGQL